MSISSLLSIQVAQAALIDRGNGLIYDDDLNITWLADANYAMTSGYDSDGRMTWADAMSWANNLNYQGYTDWRIASSDGTCNTSSGADCAMTELGHLYYMSLVAKGLHMITIWVSMSVLA